MKKARLYGLSVILIIAFCVVGNFQARPQVKTWDSLYLATGLDGHVQRKLNPWADVAWSNATTRSFNGKIDVASAVAGAAIGGAAREHLAYFRVPFYTLPSNGQYTFEVDISYSSLPFSMNMGAPIVSSITAGMHASNSMLFLKIGGENANPNPTWCENDQSCHTITSFRDTFIQSLAMEGFEVITGNLGMSLKAATITDFTKAISDSLSSLGEIAKKGKRRHITLKLHANINKDRDYLWIGSSAGTVQAGLGESQIAFNGLFAQVTQVRVYRGYR